MQFVNTEVDASFFYLSARFLGRNKPTYRLQAERLQTLAECLQPACRVLATCLQSACNLLATCLQNARTLHPLGIDDARVLQAPDLRRGHSAVVAEVAERRHLAVRLAIHGGDYLLARQIALYGHGTLHQVVV